MIKWPDYTTWHWLAFDRRANRESVERLLADGWKLQIAVCYPGGYPQYARLVKSGRAQTVRTDQAAKFRSQAEEVLM
jgi:hypothetical protein